MPAKNKSNELKITRLYDAPVEIVWDAWTDPQKVAKWWGPRGFTLTHHSKDLRAGGHWHYTMHGPDGKDYPNKTKYLEVEEFKKLVYDHGANDQQGPLFQVKVEFKAQGKKTQMEMTMTWPSAEIADQMKKFIKDAGGNSTWDRLGEFLTSTGDKREIFIINRSFDAPVETLFEMWINPEHVAQWLGPKGVSMHYFEQTIAEGKTSFYKMTYDTGVDMYGKMTYVKIDRPHYLEYTQIFCDENGKLSKHPHVPVWPDVMRTRVSFHEEEHNQTRVTVVWEPDGKVSQAEIDAFINMKGGMTQGWTQSLDRLEEYIK